MIQMVKQCHSKLIIKFSGTLSATRQLDVVFIFANRETQTSYWQKMVKKKKHISACDDYLSLFT